MIPVDPCEQGAASMLADAEPKAFVIGSSKELNAIHAVVMSIGGDWPEVEGDPYTLSHVKRMARELQAAHRQKADERDVEGVFASQCVAAYEASGATKPYTYLSPEKWAYWERLVQAVNKAGKP